MNIFASTLRPMKLVKENPRHRNVSEKNETQARSHPSVEKKRKGKKKTWERETINSHVIYSSALEKETA